jgi:anti-sigma B factor antagonist
MAERNLLFENGRSSGKTLYVAGELDIASAPELERAVTAILDRHRWEFRLDLTGLTFVDSTGARALCQAQRAIEARGGRLVLTGARRPVRRILERIGLETLFDSDDGLP